MIPVSFGMPIWLQILRLVVTFLITIGLGIHAFAAFKTHLLAARRWMFLLFSLVFMFTTQVTFIYLIISLNMGGYMHGPFKLGLFNLLLILSYLGLGYGVNSRRIQW